MYLDSILPKFLSFDKMLTSIQKPCLIDGFVYATDAHIALKVHSAMLEKQYSYVEKYPNVVGVFNDAILNANIKIEFALLNNIFSTIPLVNDYDYEDCLNCNGEGSIFCTCCQLNNECTHCKGEGNFKKKNGKKIFNREYSVKIGTALFDPNFLKLVVQLGEILNIDSCFINANYAKKANVFYFSHDVQVLVMPKMDSDYDTVLKY